MSITREVFLEECGFNLSHGVRKARMAGFVFDLSNVALNVWSIMNLVIEVTNARAHEAGMERVRSEARHIFGIRR